MRRKINHFVPWVIYILIKLTYFRDLEWYLVTRLPYSLYKRVIVRGYIRKIHKNRNKRYKTRGGHKFKSEPRPMNHWHSCKSYYFSKNKG